MSQEYNSGLISDLYQDRNRRSTLNEMGEIADPVFMAPIIDCYLRTKDAMCLFALAEINTNDFQDIVLDKLGDLSKYRDDVSVIAYMFNQRKVYPSLVTTFADEVVVDFYYVTEEEFRRRWDSFDPTDMDWVFEYLREAGKLKENEPLLESMFFERTLGKEYDKVILSYLLRLNPKVQIAKLIEGYDQYKKTDKEMVLSKELIPWENGQVPKLKQMIIDNGSSRASEILRQAEEKKQKRKATEEQKAVEQQQVVFPNTEVVQEISDLRLGINDHFLADENCKFAIFPESELLQRQAKIVSSESELTTVCQGLRDILAKVDNKTGKHGYSDEESMSLIPGSTVGTISKPINRLYLFLHRIGLPIDVVFSDMRSLLALLNSLAGHPNDRDDLISRLKDANLHDPYQKQDWEFIHKEVLKRYKEFLSGLLTTLKQQ